jgi:WD40 repeat protein
VERINTHKDNFAVLYVAGHGESFLNRTAFLSAGLLPRLEAHRITSTLIRPGPKPFASLTMGLQKFAGADSAHLDPQKLERDPKALATWLAGRPEGEQIVLVIDQAEELFTQNRDTQVKTHFLTLIANALDRSTGTPLKAETFTAAQATEAMQAMGFEKLADPRIDDEGIWCAAASRDDESVDAKLDYQTRPLRVIFTIRSEFEPQFALSPLQQRWSEARYWVPRMTPNELRRIIEEPAAVKVMRFESQKLVDDLVNEVVQMPGALPLLSFALSEMYKKYLDRNSTDRAITLQDYRALDGGVTGSLKLSADNFIKRLTPSHQSTARCVLERMVSIEGGQYARRRVTGREFEAAEPAENARVQTILKGLVNERLVVSDAAYLELAHDALILGWDRLLGWVREDAQRIADLRRLTLAATEWQSLGAPKSGPLWDDPSEIKEIEALQASAFPGLNRIEKDFATASVKRAKRTKYKWRVLYGGIAATLAVIALFWYLNSLERARSLAERGQRFLNLKDYRNAEVCFAESLTASRSDAVHEQLVQARVSGGYFDSRTEAAKILTVGPDGERADYSQGNIVLLWGDSEKQSFAIAGVDGAAFSPNGQRLLVWTIGGMVAVITRMQSQIAFLDLASGQLDNAAIDTDGTTIAYSIAKRGTEPGALYVQRTQTGWKRRLKLGDGTSFPALLFSPTGTVLATGSSDNIITIWSLSSDEPGMMFSSDRHADEIRSLAFSADGNLLASGSSDASIRLWNIEKKLELRRFDGHIGQVHALAFSPNGKSLISGSMDDRSLRYWDLSTGSLEFTVQHDHQVAFVAARRDKAGIVLIAADDKRQTQWMLPQSIPEKRVFSMPGSAQSVAFSPDGNWIAAGGDDATRSDDVLANHQSKVALFSLVNDAPPRYLEGNAASILAVTFSSDGNVVATGGRDKLVHLWDFQTGTKLRGPQAGKGEVWGVAFNRDGEVAYVGRDGDVRIWNQKTGELQKIEAGAELYGVGFSFDSRYLGYAGVRQDVQYLDRTTSKSIELFKFPSGGGSYTLNFAPSSYGLVVGGTDSNVYYWSDFTRGAPPTVLPTNGAPGHGGIVLSAAICESRQKLVSGSTDNTIRLWDLQSKTSVALYGHSRPVWWVSCNDKKNLVASASIDGRVNVWNLDAINKLFSAAPTPLLKEAKQHAGVSENSTCRTPGARSAVSVSSAKGGNTVLAKIFASLARDTAGSSGL